MPWSVVTDKLDNGKRIVYDVVCKNARSPGPSQIVYLKGTEWDWSNGVYGATPINHYSHAIAVIIHSKSGISEDWWLCGEYDYDIETDTRITIYEAVRGFKTKRHAIEHRLRQMGLWDD